MFFFFKINTYSHFNQFSSEKPMNSITRLLISLIVIFVNFSFQFLLFPRKQMLTIEKRKTTDFIK